MSYKGKPGFQVYRLADGEFRALLVLEHPRAVRTVVLPVSTRRAAGLLAQRLFIRFTEDRTVSLLVKAEFRARSLASLLYDYVGSLWRGRGRQWKTVIGYRRHLIALFGACGWRHPRDVSAERFLRWQAGLPDPALAHRVRREACAFFDSLVVHGAMRANPLRQVHLATHYKALYLGR